MSRGLGLGRDAFWVTPRHAPGFIHLTLGSLSWIWKHRSPNGKPTCAFWIGGAPASFMMAPASILMAPALILMAPASFMMAPASTSGRSQIDLWFIPDRPLANFSSIPVRLHIDLQSIADGPLFDLRSWSIPDRALADARKPIQD
jgi:hypothetical protein